MTKRIKQWDGDGEPRVIPHIIAFEREELPERTGLLDQYGVDLYRVKEKIKFGFTP